MILEILNFRKSRSLAESRPSSAEVPAGAGHKADSGNESDATVDDDQPIVLISKRRDPQPRKLPHQKALVDRNRHIRVCRTANAKVLIGAGTGAQEGTGGGK